MTITVLASHFLSKLQWYKILKEIENLMSAKRSGKGFHLDLPNHMFSGSRM